MSSAIYRLIQYWQTVELDSFHKDLKIPLLNEFAQAELQSSIVRNEEEHLGTIWTTQVS